jgi:hypothetical protein
MPGFSFVSTNGLPDDIQNGSQTYALVSTADIVTTNGTKLTEASVSAITAGAVDTVATVDSVLDHAYFFAPVVRAGDGSAFGYAQRIPDGVDTHSPLDWEALGPGDIREIGSSQDPSTQGDVNRSQLTIPGACCVDDTPCQVVTFDVCEAASGSFVGFGSTCEPIDPCTCVTVAEARAAGVGAGVLLCDVVVSSTTDLIASASSTTFHVQDATGGVTVYGAPADIDPLLTEFGEGYLIDLAGSIDEFNGLIELIAPFTLVSNDGFVGIPEPTLITVADLQEGSAVAELNESKLVMLECVEFVAAGGTFAGVANYTVTADGGTTTAVVRVPTSTVDLVGEAIPSGFVHITGILSQFDSTAPKTGGYQLLMRSMGDIEQCP